MRIIRTISDLFEVHQDLPRPLGMVPTMGYLHDGHIALLRQARNDNASVVATIFVNPTQFGPSEDFSNYPRDMKADLAKLESEGVDVVFSPAMEEMYPIGFDTFIDVGEITSKLEGKSRPGHFRGVATIVCKLLTIVHPDRAYFGQKDAQQCLVIKRLNADLHLGVEIVVVPTFREADGLALSSRNVHLDQDERLAARVIYESLCLAKRLLRLGNYPADYIRGQMVALFERQPLARIDYISLADPVTLDELDLISSSVLISVAVYIGKTRLIDNMVL